ncbi:MAG: hypothetical protein CMH83_14020 [Nocardioides sp.]|nr:hypothetical protein [Nocardioides sp.]
MTTLLVKVEGRTLRFDRREPVRIGRSIDADVLLTASSVSRRHAVLEPDGDAWVLVDQGSQFGTFVDERAVTRERLVGPATVRCGLPTRGATFEVVPEVAADDAALTQARPPAAVPDTPPEVRGTEEGLDETVVISGAAIRAHGEARERSGPDLLVVAADREHRFRHPSTLKIGRHPDSDVVVDDPVCSRRHVELTAEPGGWRLRSLSESGTWSDGRRVTDRFFDSRLDLRLGHPVAGPTLTLAPLLSAEEEERRFARRRRGRWLAVAGMGLALSGLVAVAVVGALLAFGGSGRDSLDVLTGDELDRAKAATVQLVGESTDGDGGTVRITGSGSVLTSDGLILTNAHVAAPSAPGLEEFYPDEPALEDPDYLLVALVDPLDDSPASPSYRARPVVVDGERDVAVVQVYADADGNDLTGDLDLATMPLGDSDEMSSGDQITVLGFPGISGSARLSVTTGVVSTFIDRGDLGPRSEIDTDARIAPGNSGGAAINNDAEIIGIPSATFQQDGSPVVSGRIRPINFVMDVIEEAEAEVDDR